MKRKRYNRIRSVLLAALIFLASLEPCVFAASAQDNTRAAAGGSLIAFYDFNGNLNNEATAGVTVTVSETPNSASRTYGQNQALSDPTYLQWTGAAAPGYGLQLSVNKDISQVYSIAMRFSYTNAASGYKKIIDYTNYASDYGFYLLYGKLIFYNAAEAQGSTVFRDDQLIDLIVTRDSSDIFTVYSIADGITRKEFSFKDTAGATKGKLNGSKTIFGFYRDEHHTTEHSPGGKAYSIKIWDYALSEEEAGMAAEPISVTYKTKEGGTIKTASYNPGAEIVLDTFETTEEFRGWRGSDGLIYQPGDRFSVQTATTFTAITVPLAPTWEESGGIFRLYGNGNEVVIRESGASTAVFWDSDRDGVLDNPVLVNGTSGESAVFDAAAAENLYVYGGGKEDTMDRRDAGITLEGGTVRQILGCGRGANASVRSVLIALKGGTVHETAAYDDGSKVTGSRDITVSGNPRVTGMVDISTAEAGWIAVTGALDGQNGEIRLGSRVPLGDQAVVAVASDSSNAKPEAFSVDGHSLTAKGNKIIIEDAWSIALDHQEGTGGDETVGVAYQAMIPESVAIPARNGYQFGGYYTEPKGAGSRYYDENGSRAYDAVVTGRTVKTLYAFWIAERSTITQENGNSDDIHVQGKIVDGSDYAVYKLDIEWGEMKFDYALPMSRWDPETHSYQRADQGEAAADGYWREECFDNGNNRILISNHSNGDLRVTGEISSNLLEGVMMEVKEQNRSDAQAAVSLALPKVPEEGAAAPVLSIYLRLSGIPRDIGILKENSYSRVGVVTITVTPDGTVLTPRRGT